MIPQTPQMGDATPTVAQDPNQPQPSPFTFLEAPQLADEIGRLGRFRILELLGEGGMGFVFRADDPDLNRHVALKVMKPEVARGEQGRKRFLREARAAAAIEHDHVIPIHQVGEVGGVPFLVMPLLKGESLDDRLRRRPKLSPAEAAHIGRETAEGLAAAHAAGLVHRDIKPSNLWLERTADGGERVKVLDFGLARAADAGGDATVTGALVGTPGYMAPEQARAEKVDGRTDLFALGCVLYRMYTGQAPFEGASLTALLTQLATHHPPPPNVVEPTVPAALSDLVMRLLAKEPGGRPSSARDVANGLRETERSLATVAMPPLTAPPGTAATTTDPNSAFPRTTAPARRRKWLLAAAVILIVGILAVAAAVRRAPPATRPLPFVNAVGGGPESGPAIVSTTPRAVPPARHEGPGSTAIGSAVASSAPAALKGYIDVILYDPANPLRQNVRLNAQDVVPLKPGDRFAVEAEMNPPAYLYMLWIDADGSVDPVYPWIPGRWEDRPTREEPVGRLRRPEAADHWFKIRESAPGMETLVLLAREQPLPANADLRAALGRVPRQTFQTLQSTVWFENGEVVRHEQGRSAADWDEERSADPVRATQEQIRSRLGGLFPYTRAVSFADRGK